MSVNKNSIKESGRSMIEMLGVLAVIGVLSVGGIAGYSKAMERYRVNETINQITHIVQNTRDLFKSQKDYTGLNNYKTLDIIAKFMPESVRRNNYNHLWNFPITFYVTGLYKEGDNKAFMLYYNSIPMEACVALTTYDWKSLGVVALRTWGGTINQGPSYYAQNAYKGNCITKYKKSDGLFCYKDIPATPEQASLVCDSENYNFLYFKFY